MGAYVVFPAAEEATAAIELEKANQSEDTGQTPLALAGFEGTTLFNEEGAASGYLTIANFLLLGTDIILQDGTRVHPGPASIRSTYYMVALLDHLRSINRPDD